MKLFIQCLLVCHLAQFAVHAAQTTDPERAFEEIKAIKVLPSPPASWRITQPAESELSAFQTNYVQAATNFIFQCETFRTRFSASPRLAEVNGMAVDTLYKAFGSGRFQVPETSAAHIYQTTTNLLQIMPGDTRLQMTVARTVTVFPPGQAIPLCESFIKNNPGEPAKSIAETALKKLQRVGQPLALRFNSLDGRPVDLQQHKGKVVILNFWATWCMPCVRELKEVRAILASAPPNSVAVVSLSLDTDEAEVKSFVQREKLAWPQYFSAAGPESPLLRDLGVKSVPEVWLIDKNGVLRDVQGGERMKEKVNRLLTDR